VWLCWCSAIQQSIKLKLCKYVQVTSVCWTNVLAAVHGKPQGRLVMGMALTVRRPDPGMHKQLEMCRRGSNGSRTGAGLRNVYHHLQQSLPSV
jgi:hypothetical protein